MAQVKVYNDNTHPYTETFKDNKIVIPAGGFVEMEYYEAHEFKGTYKAIERDGDNQPLPSSYKKIRIEELKAGEVDAKIESNKCVACSFRGSSALDLHGHILAAHSEQVAKVDEEAEQVLKSKKRAG
jgi:hypothetical protein